IRVHLLGHAVNRRELGHRSPFGGLVALGCARSLAHEHGEKRHVVAAGFHLVEVDLRVHGLRVRLGRRKIVRNVLVRVDGDDALMDIASTRHQVGTRLRTDDSARRTARYDSECAQTKDGESHAEESLPMAPCATLAHKLRTGEPMLPLRFCRALALAAATTACGAVAACSGDLPNTTIGSPVTDVGSVVVTPSELRLEAGQTGTLTAQVMSVDGSPLTGRTVTWS